MDDNNILLIRRTTLVLLLVMLKLTMMAQAMLTGQIVDADDGGPIPYASASYKGQHKAVSSDADGKFSIERHEGWTLTFSSVGYTPVSITVNAATKELTIKLKSESRKIDEIVVKARRGKYRRKDNPAVELMRRVIAAKKRTHLDNHPYYQFKIGRAHV